MSRPDETTIDLMIEAMAHGGRGVGFHDRRPVFVPYTIPGERVRARLVTSADGYSNAEGVTLIEASADRVYPACPHFGPGRCGGCQWQHIAPAVQPLLKQDVIADQLSRLGGLRDPVIERVLRPMRAAPAAWEYNEAISFAITPDGTLGLASTDGGRILPIAVCPITHPDVWALRDSLDLDLTGITRVKLMRGGDGSGMIILTLATEEDAPELEADIAASINAILPDNEPLNLIGDSHVRVLIKGETLRVTAGSYLRANVGALGGMIDAVVDLLPRGDGLRALDLYAGVGVFSAFLAPRLAHVTLVESYPPAVTDADDNLKAFDNVDVIEGGVEAVLPALADEPRFDVAIVDAPRRLAREVIDDLGTLGLRSLIRIIGDPAELARDVKALTVAGWRLDVVQPIDLAPQTYYTDCVARFVR